jgi:GNAT superfamily N-acetyltransferase
VSLTMADLLQSAAAYLKTDVLKHIVHLKMIEAYAEHITCHYDRRGAQEGALLLIPTPVIPFDAKTYPDSEFVVLLAGSAPEMVGRLVRHIPRQTSLVFKLVDDMTRDVVLRAFPCRRTAAFVSYTAGERRFRPHPSVVMAAVLDERLLACYQANGYTPGELAGFFKHGALSFTIYDDGAQPLSTCFTFKNYDTIWEIGGVYTDPAQRRKGLARLVVETALDAVLSRGYIPRYQVAETNIASMRLAETSGLTKFVVVEHYLYNAVE